MLRVAIANQVKGCKVDRRLIRRAVQLILREAGIETALVSIAIVDDNTIAQLHGQYLKDPSPTDVLSFPLETTGTHIEGEIVVSYDTAQTQAARLGIPSSAELLLYVIHGTLHLVGYDDTKPSLRRKMRAAEKRYLTLLGISPEIIASGRSRRSRVKTRSIGGDKPGTRKCDKPKKSGSG